MGLGSLREGVETMARTVMGLMTSGSEGQPDLRRGVEIDSAGARVSDEDDNLIWGMEANIESRDPGFVTR